MALYVLNRHARDELTAAGRFVARLNGGLWRFDGQPWDLTAEEKELKTWAEALERELGIVIKAPVFDHFKRRVEKATSLDEVNRLMHCATGEYNWQGFFTSVLAARHITNAGRSALTGPATELCCRRLKREFAQL